MKRKIESTCSFCGNKIEGTWEGYRKNIHFPHYHTFSEREIKIFIQIYDFAGDICRKCRFILDETFNKTESTLLKKINPKKRTLRGRQ